MGRGTKVLCLHCDAKMPFGAAFCPKCEHPTGWATHEQRVGWEISQWRAKRPNVPQRERVASAPRAPVHRVRMPARRAEPPAPAPAPAPPRVVDPPAPVPPRVVDPPAPVPPRVVDPPAPAPPRVVDPPAPVPPREPLLPVDPARVGLPSLPAAPPPEPEVRPAPPIPVAEPSLFFMPPSGIVDAFTIPVPEPDPRDVLLEEVVSRLRAVQGQVASLDARVEELVRRRRPIRRFRREQRRASGLRNG